MGRMRQSAGGAMGEGRRKRRDVPGGFFFFLVMSPFVLEGSIVVEARLKGGRDEEAVRR